MALDSRLANLSLSQIAELLSPKQQEVLLASISVAASFIQQLQQEEQQTQQQQQQHQQQQQQLNTSSNHQTSQQLNDTINTLNLSSRHNQRHIQQSNQHQMTNSMTMTPSILSDTHDSLEAHDNTFEQDETYETFDETDETNDESDGGDHHRHSRHQAHGHNNGEPLSEKDEKELLIIRQFADELKQRRKAIRLSQKGAAQSLRAFTNGVQPCTDAIIYHFENLQLEPERAVQLIPLLRDWLEWAEKHRYNGQQLPMMSAVTKVPRERKRKVVLFNEKAKQHLEDAFMKNNHPDRFQLDVISQELSIPTRSIRKWFTNRRQRKRFAEKFSPIG